MRAVGVAGERGWSCGERAREGESGWMGEGGGGGLVGEGEESGSGGGLVGEGEESGSELAR